MINPADHGINDRQLHWARFIVQAVKARGLPMKAAVISLATAMTESGLRMLASANVPESQKYPHDLLPWTDDGLGHDHASIGMFQQQTGTRWTPAGYGWAMNQTTINTLDGWGTPAELMDPIKCTDSFLDALANVDWQHMTNWDAAQATQNSAFADGSNYRANDTRATALAEAIWNDKQTDILTELEPDMDYVITSKTPGKPALILVAGKPVKVKANTTVAAFKKGGAVQLDPLDDRDYDAIAAL